MFVPSGEDPDYSNGDELQHAMQGKKRKLCNNSLIEVGIINVFLCCISELKYTDPPMMRSKNSPQPSTSKAKPPKVARKKRKTAVKVDRAERPLTRRMTSVRVQPEEISRHRF